MLSILKQPFQAKQLEFSEKINKYITHQNRAVKNNLGLFLKLNIRIAKILFIRHLS